MHISDGVLSLEVTVVSTIVAFAFFVYSFRSLNNEKIVLASAFSALFFVASFIHIPFGPTQIHLMLLGFIGVFLGSVAIFSISLALILQALLLGFGGVSSIGVNVLIMGLASYLVYIIFKLNFFKALNEKVKFLGKLLPKNLREVTKKADVGLSIEENNGLSYYYSMPNKVSDYIQSRIPVIVSDFPEMRKVIDRFQTGEKIKDHAQLAEKIEIVLKNGKVFYKDVLNKAAAELCWEKEEPKLLQLFKKVTDENF